MERTEIYNQFEELNKRASQGGGIDKIEKTTCCRADDRTRTHRSLAG